jgi:DNA-binding transcriptional MerR regulator
MAYKVKKLIDEGFDFDTLFPERVEEARQSTLLNFTIKEIVEFIKVQTQDFTQDFPLAHDLDKAIYRVYEKKMELEKGAEEPKPDEGTPTPKEGGERKPASKESLERQIKALTYLAEKKNNESAKKQLKAFKFLLKKYIQ